MKKSTLAVAVVVLACITGDLYAAGFRLAEQSASANGMGNAFVAVADDASAVWYNPAALTSLEKTNLSLGGIMVFSQNKHTNTESTIHSVGGNLNDNTAKTSTLRPHFYAATRLSDKWALGLGANVPFGLSTSWDDTVSPTRSVATYSDIQAIDYNLNAAYKITDKLSFALGLDYYALKAEMNRWITVAPSALGWWGAYDDEQVLRGEGHGTGYNAAVMYKHNDKLQFGANYRSGALIDIKGSIYHPVLGSIAFQNYNMYGANNGFSAPIPPAGQVNASNGGSYYNDANARIHLPDTFQLGTSYKYNDKWLFSAEADWTNWATYHRLVIKWYDDKDMSVENKGWKSVWAYRLGTQYKYSDAWKFRAGVFYDNTPVPNRHLETRLPDSDRTSFSLGASWNKGGVTVDASYMYLMFKDRVSVNSLGGSSGTTQNHLLDGKYSASAQLPALTVSYKF
jgi:long-chain fatty acid transport protein